MIYPKFAVLQYSPPACNCISLLCEHVNISSESDVIIGFLNYN